MVGAVVVGLELWWIARGNYFRAASLIVAVIVAEGALRVAVRAVSRQDGLVAIDEPPRISEQALDRFFDHGFDPELGWIRKANTSKKDLGKYAYKIDARGSRANPGHEHLPVLVSTYGDSYTFCREVEDADTWQWHLAEQIGANVLNFGVGNYGLDQSLLRFEREYSKNPTPVVVMGVVPSTIGRILSVWKHYNEFGNLFAFKPRFLLDGDALRLVPNRVAAREDFFALDRLLPAIQTHDEFFERRFKREAFRAPFVLSAVINWRSLMLPAAKALRRMSGSSAAAPMAALVSRLDRGGVAQTSALFAEPSAVALFRRLAREFADRARAAGAAPLLVVMPMKDDMFYMRRHGHFYADALGPLCDYLPVVDAGPRLLQESSVPSLFREWHYSPLGNQIIAGLLAPPIRRILSERRAAAPLN